ncbi:MAG: trypsin-like peptidase domain-containing protein [Myxococcales bacterium]|nr:trypsin-like peptidase domain-containing protein [Myxococcales bacterium]
MPTPPDLSNLSDRALLTEYALRLRTAPAACEEDRRLLLAPLLGSSLMPEGAQLNSALEGLSLEELGAALANYCERNVPGHGDSRKELDDDGVTKQQRACARSVALVVGRNSLEEQPDGSFKLDNQPLHERVKNLCRDEPFREQSTARGARGTGFLFEDSLHLMTTNHVLLHPQEGDDPSALRVVFGFHNLTNVTSLPAASVFDVAHIESRSNDLMRLRLNRPVALDGIEPLTPSAHPVQPGSRVYAVGHPYGLPMKVTGSAGVSTATRPQHLQADLDTYACSSGSPVLHAETHAVVGVAVRGAIIFLNDHATDCQHSMLCSILYPGTEFVAIEHA